MSFIPPTTWADLFTGGREFSSNSALWQGRERNRPHAAILKDRRMLGVANAITAVLLHAEAIQRFTVLAANSDEIEASSEAIKQSVKAIWSLCDDSTAECLGHAGSASGSII